MKKDLREFPDMQNITNREKQFHLIPSDIEERKIALQELPFDELAQMFRIHEGIDPGDPQTVVGRVSRADKKKMVNSIINHMVKNHHPVTEERYQFVEWLYRIRKQYRRMGLFQPDFTCIIFGKMMVSKLTRTDTDIHNAVNDWCEDPARATVKYGHISKWNTSLVTNMRGLFEYKRDFNDDISKWNVSNVTDMSFMFKGYILGRSSSFNGDISRWNVSSVTNMESMFMSTPFNGDISGWDVSSVTNMRSMFINTPFNGDISGWDVSSVTDMGFMFMSCPIQEQHKPERLRGNI